MAEYPPALQELSQYEGLVVAMTIEEQKFIERKLAYELKRRAIEQGIARTMEELVVRDIFPVNDLGQGCNEWTQSGVIPSCAWGLVYSGRVDDDKVIGFIGVKDETPTAYSGGVPQKTLYTQTAGLSGYGGAARPATAIKFMLGDAKIKDQWMIQHIYVQNPPEAFTFSPVIYNKSELYRIYMYGRTGHSGQPSNLILRGKVCEPKGKLIMGIE
jgi:hypothetical protein